MRTPPKYFNAIKDKAHNMWVKLDNDPELAGPWHQLFAQVQSPRHIISELLQNADDARATEACVAIENGVFVFSHNGVDFTEEHFASLCRFGYSNKRSLHTIGFRGIGFKSTFSIGVEVDLLTPTLSVRFHSEHFTEPIWLNEIKQRNNTEIRVAIKDEYCLKELEKNIDEWINSSPSLLFFSNIKSLVINNHEISWVSSGKGPVSGSHWYVSSTRPDQRILLIKSEPEEFPPEAIEEIRKERMLKSDELCFPPCIIDVVLGIKGRLYVILPTGVSMNTPFACNAPFIQDPARVNIKDPSVSFTNRWLLDLIGRVVSRTLIEWLSKTELSIEERSCAYELLTDVDRDDKSLNGSCAAIIEERIDNYIRDLPFLITEFGDLCLWGKCTAIHQDIFEIWNPNQVANYFNKDDRRVLSHYITQINQKKLISWGCINEQSMLDILGVLKSRHLPKPNSWNQLRKLWSLIADDISSYNKPFQKSIRIVPVQGQSVLYSSSEVVRLGEKQLLRDKDDWSFLSEYLIVFNQNWSRYLAEQKREARESENRYLAKSTERTYRVLRNIGLDDTSNTSLMINRVAKLIISDKDVSRDKIIRIAHIAAQLGTSVSEDFPYVTHEGIVKSANMPALSDISGALSLFVVTDWYRANVISDLYNQHTSCSLEEWRQWIISGKSRLQTFIPLRLTKTKLWGRSKLEAFLATRGYVKAPFYRYVKDRFMIEDWEYPSDVWQYWINCAREDKNFWCKVLDQILLQDESYWAKTNSIQVRQVATTGSTRSIIYELVLPKWISEFRELPCIQDTHGVAHVPSELMLRNASTEALLDIEPFVRGDLDNAKTKSLLLLLGVRDFPSGAQSILERIALLVTVKDPPILELLKWYSRLDILFNDCSTEDRNQVIDCFTNKQLILTESNEWCTSVEVFLNPLDDEFPDLASVIQHARGLSLWQKIGVKERPSLEYALDWLTTIESGSLLNSGTLKRVRALTAKYPDTIWSETQHWINIESEWVPIDDLEYSLSMQTLVQWKHLYKAVKHKTADLTRLAVYVCSQSPFNKLKNLVDVIVEKKNDSSNTNLILNYSEWIAVFGKCLMRVRLDIEEETAKTCQLSRTLSQTQICYSDEIKITPYIDNIPAGTSRFVNCLWDGNVLFVIKKSEAQLANTVSREIGRYYARQDVMDAVKLCYARSAAFIKDYCNEIFTLMDKDPNEPDQHYHKGSEEEPKDSVNEFNSEEPKDSKESINESFSDEKTESTASVDDENQQEEDPLDESTSENSSDQDQEQPKSQKQSTKKKTTPLIMRFTKMKGFMRESDDRYFNSKGERIIRSSNVFPWERYSANGNLAECYWLKDHCLLSGALQIGAEIIELCRENPTRYTIILIDENENPIEITGVRFNQMIESNDLLVFPDKYRLILSNK